MRTARWGALAATGLVVLAGCTQSPSSPASPSQPPASASQTPTADFLELLTAALEDPDMGFTTAFDGVLTVSAPDDPSSAQDTDLSGTIEAAGADVSATVVATAPDGSELVNAQIFADGSNYVSSGDGPFIEDQLTVRVPSVREALLAVLDAEGVAAPTLQGAEITVEPGSDDCSLLLQSLLLLDQTLQANEIGPCHVMLSGDASGVLEDMAIVAEVLGASGDVPIQFAWDIGYEFSAFGPAAEIAAPAEPWTTYAWNAASAQIGYPADWETGGTDVSPHFLSRVSGQIVALTGGLAEGAEATPENALYLAEQMLLEQSGLTAESREPVNLGLLPGTLLSAHVAASSGTLHYMSASTAHPSGRIYVIEFVGAAGTEEADEVFFRTMLATMLFGP
jgi:hypothetical protein